MPDPTLAFGEHSSGRILHISEAVNGANCHCICPRCDLPLIAKTGHKTPHFAHRPEAASGIAGCGTTGQMTALHRFARDLFLDGGRVHLPTISQDGHSVGECIEVDLADVRIEKRFDGYQPDVVFTESGRSLLMEIAVTHPVPPSKASLIRLQRVEAFEIDIEVKAVPGDFSREAVENYVRLEAPRRWIFNESLENYLRSLYHLDGVRERGQLTSETSRSLAVLYDRMAGLRKVPAPAVAAKKALVSDWLTEIRPSFEGYFRTAPDDWRAFVLLECVKGLGLPLRRIVNRLKAAEHLHIELTRFVCSETQSAEAGLPTLGVNACVFTFLSDLENRGVVVCLPGGIWRLLVELSEERPLPLGPLPVRPTRSELTVKRRNEVDAILQRIAAKLSPADSDEFASGIEAWWKRPVDGSKTPLEIITVANYRFDRLKKQLVAIDQALVSVTPDLSMSLGLPMSEALSAHAERAALVERQEGFLRGEKLQERALQKYGTEVASIWLGTRPQWRRPSPMELAVGSKAGLKISLDELEQRFVSNDRISDFQEKFRVWAERKFRGGGLRFIRENNNGLPDRRTPLQCCFDDVSLRIVQELTVRALDRG